MGHIGRESNLTQNQSELLDCMASLFAQLPIREKTAQNEDNKTILVSQIRRLTGAFPEDESMAASGAHRWVQQACQIP